MASLADRLKGPAKRHAPKSARQVVLPAVPCLGSGILGRRQPAQQRTVDDLLGLVSSVAALVDRGKRSAGQQASKHASHVVLTTANFWEKPILGRRQADRRRSADEHLGLLSSMASLVDGAEIGSERQAPNCAPHVFLTAAPFGFVAVLGRRQPNRRRSVDEISGLVGHARIGCPVIGEHAAGQLESCSSHAARRHSSDRTLLERLLKRRTGRRSQRPELDLVVRVLAVAIRAPRSVAAPRRLGEVGDLHQLLLAMCELTRAVPRAMACTPKGT
mmetsp:Transcript_7843/g.19926  ORF Transcript_7843/g.19926 Transcript_7843/m.19926 type:complete len:274 (-) Transcript_7843:297-1118(-)